MSEVRRQKARGSAKKKVVRKPKQQAKASAKPVQVEEAKLPWED
jgi:hypothetical protein